MLPMIQKSVERLITTRIPTDAGTFHLCLYDSPDGKDHLALVAGAFLAAAGSTRENVLVRIHSECFTGDVLGSQRCDCGEQLQRAIEIIAEEGAGIVIYLRQEGRGIGLLDKLRAYNLQDEGYDTVDANLMLGHEADERDYTVAAGILRDLGVASVRLLTNNPDKIESLDALGIPVTGRVPLYPQRLTADNAPYLRTKVQRMRHLLALDGLHETNGRQSQPAAGPAPLDLFKFHANGNGSRTRPLVTLSYAQTLDGSITARRGEPLAISGAEALRLTHQLRAAHDAILVGVDTVLADNPRLTVRLVEGRNPRPVVLDSRLRLPLEARLLTKEPRPILATTAAADPARQAALEAAGATVWRLPAETDGRVSLPPLLRQLGRGGLRSLMVEGGARVIGSFLAAELVDQVVVTLTMRFAGGLPAVGSPLPHLPHLANPQQKQLGPDLIIWGKVAR